MPTDRIPGVILAGGLARRMGGGDKSLKTLGDRPVLAHVIDRLRPQVSAIALNANGDPERFAELGLPVISDPMPDYPGPLAGVLAGLDWAAGQGAAAIVTVAADTPFFPANLSETLQKTAKAERSPLVLSATPGPDGKPLRHPTFGLWPVSLRADLAAALKAGIRKIVRWTDQHGAATAVFDANPIDPFFNINTPEDMVEAERILREVR